jgi:hypothetical protein
MIRFSAGLGVYSDGSRLTHCPCSASLSYAALGVSVEVAVLVVGWPWAKAIYGVATGFVDT